MSIMLAQAQNPSATIKRPSRVVSTDELIAYCPVCKSFETVWHSGGRLVQTRKFSQYGARIYHDCGADHAICIEFREEVC